MHKICLIASGMMLIIASVMFIDVHHTYRYNKSFDKKYQWLIDANAYKCDLLNLYDQKVAIADSLLTETGDSIIIDLNEVEDLYCEYAQLSNRISNKLAQEL